MNIALLSGGSGKRLWPLSNELRSKQFLKLLNSETGKESMVQRVYGQINRSGIKADITVVTNKTQSELIRAQLGGEVSVVVEPERRDTFPDIAVLCAHLFFRKKLERDAVVIVLPVDPYAEDTYFKCLVKMEQAVAEGKANLVLMGIKPTYPSQKYGYITREGGFVEKPTLETAKKLVTEEAYWNGGAYILEAVEDLFFIEIILERSLSNG
ncbi:hypothetical protein FACS189490_11070 [Clostridia bacterium]|nr:hypothetical protein FACS189490_11070 [Clostridia bacterium]